MIRGIETLSELEETIRSLRTDIASIDARKEALFAATQENKAQQAKALEGIAKLHFDALSDGEDAAGYTEDDRIQTLLVQRQQAFERLGQEIHRLSDQIAAKEEARAKAHVALEEALMRLAKVQEEVQNTLKKDPHYQAQFKKTQHAKEIAERTAQKAKASIESYHEKMHPFEKERLFWYLWQRGYGTSAYKGSGLTRWLDGWVAKLSHYEENRRTYWTLSQIPKYLEEHAKSKAEVYHQELEKLIAIEKAEASAQGMDEAKKEVDQKQARVDALDADIAALEEKLDGLLEEQKRYLQESDVYAREITERIESALSRFGASTIHEIAQKTTTPQDDRLAEQLQRLEQKERELQHQIAENRTHYEKQLTALRETEALRRRFKASRYDDIHSGFDNNIGMGTILGEILSGALSNAGAWDRVSRHQRPMDNGWLSDFGSGGFGGGNSPWYSPGSSGGFSLPDIGGVFDSDTFRTGGGF